MGEAEKIYPGKIIYIDKATELRATRMGVDPFVLMQQAQQQAMSYAQQQTGMTDLQWAIARQQQQASLNVIGSYGLANAYKPVPTPYEQALAELDELFPGLEDRILVATHERYVEPRWLRFLRWLAKHL